MTHGRREDHSLDTDFRTAVQGERREWREEGRKNREEEAMTSLTKHEKNQRKKYMLIRTHV